MKKGLIVVVASLAFSLLVAAPAIPADPATTSPGYNFTITVTVKDNDVILSRSVAKRPVAWYAEQLQPSTLLATSPRVIEPGYPRPDVGTYMLFQRQ